MTNTRHTLTLALGMLCGACVGDIAGINDKSGSADPTAPQDATRPPGSQIPQPGQAGQSGLPLPTSPEPGGPSGPSFACAANKRPSGAPWRRLSQAQYRNTVRDLIAFGLKDPAAAATLFASLPTADLPDDAGGLLQGSFGRANQDVAQDHVQSWYKVAVSAGRALASKTAVLLGPCATDAATDNDSACLTDFVRRFGERAFRRPLADDEVTFYRGFYGSTAGVEPAGVGDVVAGLLMAPQFLFLTEHGDTAVAGKDNVYTLSAFEIASRLSYQFWDTMPDQALWDAARTGALKTPDGYARELERVVSDPRAKSALRAFFTEWLQLRALPQLTTFNDDPVFKAFAGVDLPKSGLRDALMQDVLDMVDYHVWDRPAGDRAAGLDDLLTSSLVFPKAAEVARIYGVPPWQGGAPPQVAADARPGLLTRAAFLVSGTANSRPIARGVFVRTDVLCDEIPPPPNGNAPPLPALSETSTTRQVVEALTETPGTVCASCHTTIINPIGYAMEGFDGLGRARTEQRLFSRDGKEIGRKPIDATSVPGVLAEDQRPSRGIGDLTRFIVESGKVPACLARNYYRFTFGRREDVAVDGCTLEQSRRLFARNGSLRTALRDIAQSPDFKERAF